MDPGLADRSLRGATVLVSRHAVLELCRVRRLDRLRARMRSSTLDQALARGAAPEASVDLALRAAWLYRPEQRRRLASGLQRIAHGDPVPRRSAVPVCRNAVRGALGDLEAVAERLRASGPANVHGIAQVQLLLTDGSGPLFQKKTTAEQLSRFLRSALGALDTES